MKNVVSGVKMQFQETLRIIGKGTMAAPKGAKRQTIRYAMMRPICGLWLPVMMLGSGSRSGFSMRIRSWALCRAVRFFVALYRAVALMVMGQMNTGKHTSRQTELRENGCVVDSWGTEQMGVSSREAPGTPLLKHFAHE
jgi:hypothetical protein